MQLDPNEEKLLRSVALQNAKAVLLARERAERDLLAAKEALERKTDELTQQREWFQVTLSSIGDAVITSDTDGKITFLNPVAEKLTGWTLESAVSQPVETVFRIINELTREPTVNPIEKVLRAGTIVSLANHTALIAKDGTEISIEDSAAPIQERSGNISGVVMVFRDVTKRRRAENELRRSEQLLTDFFENAAVGLHWVDGDGKILRVNQTELNLLGYSKEEYVGHHISEFHADQPVIEDILTRLSCGECLQSYEARLRCKDGSIRHVLISSNVLWEDGKFIHTRCFTRDVTNQKLTEEALRASESGLAAANAELDRKVQERTASLQQAISQMEEFSYSVSHDLRAPLRAIEAYSRFLVEDHTKDLDAEAVEHLAKIRRNIGQMNRLINDLLTLSRVSRNEICRRPIPLQQLIQEVIEQNPHMEEPHAEIQIRAPHRVLGDEISLIQALSNLLSNAVKFVPAGVKPSIKVWSEAGEKHIRLWVEDNGIGIKPEQHQKLFGMFQRLHSDPSYEGTGIGLAIVRKAVERMQGSVGVESSENGGSRFWIELEKA
jgi:PAS domain S-box-containing protein